MYKLILTASNMYKFILETGDMHKSVLCTSNRWTCILNIGDNNQFKTKEYWHIQVIIF